MRSPPSSLAALLPLRSPIRAPSAVSIRARAISCPPVGEIRGSSMSEGMRTASPIPSGPPMLRTRTTRSVRSPTFKTSMRTLSCPLAIRETTARSPSGIARLVQTVAPSAAMTESSLTGETANEASFIAARSVCAHERTPRSTRLSRTAITAVSRVSTSAITRRAATSRSDAACRSTYVESHECTANAGIPASASPITIAASLRCFGATTAIPRSQRDPPALRPAEPTQRQAARVGSSRSGVDSARLAGG